MGFYPENPLLGQKLQTAAGDGVTADKAFLAHLSIAGASAPLGTTTGAHAAVTDTGVDQTISTGITNPAYGRNVTATAGGTAGDIKAVQVTVHGKDMAGATISEALPAFTVDTPGTVSGSKIFGTITSWDLPAHDGTGATTALGYGNKLGIPYKLPHNTVLAAYLNNTKEGTPPTVTTSSSALESNGFTLASSLAGTPVDLYLMA